jgi:hypothetical protein
MRLTRPVAGRLAVAGLLVAIGLLTAGPDLSGAQLGGLLRRKIGEVVKGDEPTKEAAEKTATEPAATPASRDPNVVEVNDAVLTALENSLQTEIRLREEFRKELAALKTPEQYNACTAEVYLSPEGQKISMRVVEVVENATQAQMQAVAAQVSKDIEALTLKTCGPDVRQFNDSWRAKRLSEIQSQAAGAASAR